MENNLERWKMRTESPAIVSPCRTMKFLTGRIFVHFTRLKLVTVDFGCLPERRGDIRWLGVKSENKPWGLFSYHNPHKTLVFMVLIEKQLTIKRVEF